MIIMWRIEIYCNKHLARHNCSWVPLGWVWILFWQNTAKEWEIFITYIIFVCYTLLYIFICLKKVYAPWVMLNIMFVNIGWDVLKKAASGKPSKQNCDTIVVTGKECLYLIYTFTPPHFDLNWASGYRKADFKFKIENGTAELRLAFKLGHPGDDHVVPPQHHHPDSRGMISIMSNSFPPP